MGGTVFMDGSRTWLEMTGSFRTTHPCAIAGTQIKPQTHACPKYAEKRQQTWPNSVDLANRLWGTVEDLRRTVAVSLEMRN